MLSVDPRYFLGQVPGLECPLFAPNPTFTPLKTTFWLSYGVVSRCFLKFMDCLALFVDCYGVDRGLTMD
jgi:hypothetical protein